VIPTRDRSHLILRAVRSALAQTFDSIEVVVVIDGPDEATVRALLGVRDPRLKILTLPARVGPADARNAGVNEAQGAWIAFLDDDDEWFPHKLEVQIGAARHSRYTSPVITSRFVARTRRGEFVRPKRLMTFSEPLSEYLFTRKPFFQRPGYIHTSMLLTERALLNKVPFESELWNHEDWEWLLRVNTLKGVGIEFVPEALGVVDMKEDRVSSLSNSGDWQYSLAWIRRNRDLVTPRAFAGFIATGVGPKAAREGSWKVFWSLLQEAIRCGRPRPTDILLYAVAWLVPKNSRRWLQALLARDRST
jgi:glycosyltransferase involved in cell wall biosynthesis